MLRDRSFFMMTLLFASLQDALDTGECSKIRILMRFLTVLVCEVLVSLFFNQTLSYVKCFSVMVGV